MEKRILKLFSSLAVIAFMLLNVTKANATAAGTVTLSQDESILTIDATGLGDFTSLINGKKSDKTKTIVFNAKDIWDDTNKAATIKSLDQEGIENLVLHYNTNCTMANVTQNDFDNFQNIKRVILPMGKLDISAYTYRSTSSVEVYQQCNTGDSWPPSESKIEKVEINILKTGGLAGVAHYSNDGIANAPCVDIIGSANSEDFTFISGINNKRINLSRLAYDSSIETASQKKAEIDKFMVNKNVEYLALPDANEFPYDPYFNVLFDNMNQLKGVAYYYKKDQAYICRTKSEGVVNILTNMTAAATGSNVNIKSLKISGNLNAKDISASGAAGGTTISFNDAGHFDFNEIPNEEYSQTRTLKQYTNNNKGAFEGAKNLVKIDLEGAQFSNIQDMTLPFTGLVGNATTTIVIPTSASVTELPADFINGAQNVKDIMIPSNIQHIGARAFQGIGLLHVNTNDNKTGIKDDNGYVYYYNQNEVKRGNTATPESGEAPTYTFGTITLSSNLKRIDSYAFGGATMIYDIYCHAVDAPECHVDAFSTVTCTGNNGFNSITNSTYLSRDVYVNNGQTFAVLHFPSNTTETNVKRYKDVTREYSINIGETDDLGNTIMFPNQSEWNRAYSQGTTGYLWNAWNKIRNGLTGKADGFADPKVPLNMYETSKALYKYQRQANDAYNHNTKEVEDSLATEHPENIYGGVSTYANKGNCVFYTTNYGESGDANYVAPVEGTNLDTNTYDKDYRGWHQIVLSAYGDGSTEEHHKFNPSAITDNEWWTICLPYDLTKADMLKAYGDATNGNYPKLCKLVSVTRNIEKESIILNFGKDLVQHKENSDESTSDDDIVLKKGVPYMIKPYLPENWNQDNRIIDYVEGTEGYNRLVVNTPTEPAMKEMLLEGKYEVPTILEDNTGDNAETLSDEEGKKKAPVYTFVGTFYKYCLPSYCYFLGWNKGVKFFWNYSPVTSAVPSWNPYTAIITPNMKTQDPAFYNPLTIETVHWNYGALTTGVTRIGKTGDYSDLFSTTDDFKDGGPWKQDAQSVRSKVNMVFDVDNTATGITEIKTVDNIKPIQDSRVYNINGQLVGNSLNGLAKGIYIVNGKKYVVK